MYGLEWHVVFRCHLIWIVQVFYFSLETKVYFFLIDECVCLRVFVREQACVCVCTRLSVHAQAYVCMCVLGCLMKSRLASFCFYLEFYTRIASSWNHS